MIDPSSLPDSLVLYAALLGIVAMLVLVWAAILRSVEKVAPRSMATAARTWQCVERGLGMMFAAALLVALVMGGVMRLTGQGGCIMNRAGYGCEE